jgi:hypothetical protein
MEIKPGKAGEKGVGIKTASGYGRMGNRTGITTSLLINNSYVFFIK